MDKLLYQLQSFRKELDQQTIFCFTSDIDWASEYAISKSLQYFKDHDIPLTVFNTHKSQVIDHALQSGEIQAGIHPNFLPGSSQGNSFDEVIDFCFDLLPNAVGFRSHRHYDVNDVLEKLYARGIRYDSNVCTLLDNIPPFLQRNKLIRFPIFLEDGAYLLHKYELSLSAVDHLLSSNGLKIINIHPMHLMLNTPYFSYTRAIKDKVSPQEWNSMDEATINHLKSDKIGITNFIDELVEYIKKKNIKTAYLHNIYQHIITL